MVEYIKNNTDPMKILNHYNFQHITENENSIRACCAIHGGNNPTGFVWNKENDLWFCYTGNCGGGDIFDLIQKIENINFKEAVYKAAEILELDVSGMTLNLEKNRILNEQKQWLLLQHKKISKNIIKKYEIPFSKYTEENENFTRFENGTIKFYNSKFCHLFPTENSMLYNKLVIPLTENGECVGVALRDTTGKFNPKWMYQPPKLKVGNLLYNLENATQTIKEKELNEIILVEGIFDVWAYHEVGIDNVVAVFGSSVSEEQYKKLMKLGVGITLSFDNDDAGNKCKEKAVKLFKNKTELKTINLPSGCDPDDVKHQLMDLYLKRIPY